MKLKEIAGQKFRRVKGKGMHFQSIGRSEQLQKYAPKLVRCEMHLADGLKILDALYDCKLRKGYRKAKLKRKNKGRRAAKLLREKNLKKKREKLFNRSFY